VSAPQRAIAIDTGGTFTDCVWMENGALRTLKVFSTPDEPVARDWRSSEKDWRVTKRDQIRGRAQLCYMGTTVGTTRCCNEKALASR